METETPRGLCGWCGGPVPASRGTKPRRYCKDGCKQRAYEARKLERQLKAVREEGTEKRTAMLARAYTKGRAASSRDDVPRVPRTSRDVPRAPAQPPLFREPGEGWVRSEEEIAAQLAELDARRGRT